MKITEFLVINQKNVSDEKKRAGRQATKLGTKSNIFMKMVCHFAKQSDQEWYSFD